MIFSCLVQVVVCRLPETSTLLTYMILDRKRLDFWEWLLLFKRLSTFSQPTHIIFDMDASLNKRISSSVSPCSGRDDVEVEALVLRGITTSWIGMPQCLLTILCCTIIVSVEVGLIKRNHSV